LYHPAVLLKLYIYGCLNRVQSSRRLEHEAGSNVEVNRSAGLLHGSWLLAEVNRAPSPILSAEQTATPFRPQIF
jgi:hypothetical protein